MSVAVRTAAAIAALLVAISLLVLWALEGIVRVGTCGPAEGGGSCSPGTLSWSLLGGAAAAAAIAVALFVSARRRR